MSVPPVMVTVAFDEVTIAKIALDVVAGGTNEIFRRAVGRPVLGCLDQQPGSADDLNNVAQIVGRNIIIDRLAQNIPSRCRHIDLKQRIGRTFQQTIIPGDTVAVIHQHRQMAGTIDEPDPAVDLLQLDTGLAWLAGGTDVAEGHITQEVANVDQFGCI